MKKIIISIVTGVVILGGAGTYAFAETNEDGFFNFNEMKPYIEQMHPDFSTEEQEAMFNNCHGENGFMQNNLMNNF
ncbi:hypothetical protein [Aquibacillus saliphilus]|uniref:hypothetical protein n=1 Tax=Aquibacillus saliphilus TaxID=1909422 RepID=UPI001CEFED84|nr:hypothetical protein [Aquibacillus saliphilus]